MATLAIRNQNPGNLKNSDGSFQSFTDSTEGKAALYNDLTAKINGTSKTGLDGNSSLLEFAKTYAPASDKNDPIQYAADLANKLGISPDEKIGSLSSRIDDFASAVSSNEDPSVQYKSTNKIQKSNVNQENLKKDTIIQGDQKPDQVDHSGTFGTNPNDDTYGKIIDNSITRGIKNYGNFMTGGGVGVIGDNFVNPENHSDAEVAGAGLKTAGAIGTLFAGGGLLNGLIKGVDVLASPVLESALKSVPNGIKNMSEFINSNPIAKVNYIKEALKGATGIDEEILKQALKKVLPKAISDAGGKVAFAELHPILAKAGGLIGKLIKNGLGMAATGAGLGAVEHIYNKVTK